MPAPFQPSRSPVAIPLRAFVLSIVVLGLLSGCDLFGSEKNSDETPKPRSLTTVEKQVVETDNRFGLKLLRSTVEAEHADAGTPQNVFLSPLSVSMALGMTLNGARGETRAAMERTLEKQDLSPAEINDAYRGLIDLLETLDPNVDVALANSIWYREALPVRQAFIDTNRVHFDAEVAGLDFSSAEASDRINSWVDDETRGNIETIVPASIPDEIVMYLINATYFKGAWRTQFDPEKTEEEAFRLADGSTIQVPMMTQTEDIYHPYLRTEQFTAVDLAYGDSLYSMTLLRPNEGTSVATLVDSLDAEMWTRVTQEMKSRELSRVKVPKFTLRYEKTLGDILSNLGMDIAFDPKRANFRDIADASLFISKVKHKTFLRVNEEGTEASAATSVGVGATSVPPSIVLDRPFVLAIRENHSGTVLFLGVIANPNEG